MASMAYSENGVCLRPKAFRAEEMSGQSSSFRLPDPCRTTCRTTGRSIPGPSPPPPFPSRPSRETEIQTQYPDTSQLRKCVSANTQAMREYMDDAGEFSDEDGAPMAYIGSPSRSPSRSPSPEPERRTKKSKSSKPAPAADIEDEEALALRLLQGN